MNERVATRAVLTALVLLALAATALVAQRAPTSLTLEEAITLAKGNNPLYLSTQNDMAAANWQTREAYAAFLPAITARGAAAYQQAGVTRFGTVEFVGPTDYAFSSYSLNFNMQISGNTIFGIANARANKRATEASVDAAEWSLETRVALQYTAALGSVDQVDVAQRQVDRAQQNLRIVNTRVETGAAAGTEGRQAEVDLGRAEVALIQAQRDVRRAKLLLAERLGVALDADVELASQVDVFEPEFEVGPLIQQALASHPSLRAVSARESASKAAEALGLSRSALYRRLQRFEEEGGSRARGGG
jgi:outer membrane protein TolC